jgi:AraC-like DNA-binding protein
MIFSREKEEFDFPLHYHDEIELNLILNGAGARRIVGDHVGEVGDIELVMVGSNLPHGWFTHNCSGKAIKEVTIQFHKDLLDDNFLKRNQMTDIRKLFQKAGKGILFSAEVAEKLVPKICSLNREGNFNMVLELLSIFDCLSHSQDYTLLSDCSFTDVRLDYQSRRIDRALTYMNNNFDRQITLKDVSKVTNMPPGSFSRLIKRQTGFTFTEILAEIRLGHVSRMLIDTTQSVAEIAYRCGFNNIANFNRIFKSKKGCTPVDFKRNYMNKQLFV